MHHSNVPCRKREEIVNYAGRRWAGTETRRTFLPILDSQFPVRGREEQNSWFSHRPVWERGGATADGVRRSCGTPPHPPTPSPLRQRRGASPCFPPPGGNGEAWRDSDGVRANRLLIPSP